MQRSTAQAHGPLGNAQRMKEGTLSNLEIFLQQEMPWRNGRFLCRSWTEWPSPGNGRDQRKIGPIAPSMSVCGSTWNQDCRKERPYGFSSPAQTMNINQALQSSKSTCVQSQAVSLWWLVWKSLKSLGRFSILYQMAFHVFTLLTIFSGWYWLHLLIHQINQIWWPERDLLLPSFVIFQVRR